MLDNQEKSMDIKAILNNLPHRSPFLLIDKVVDYTRNEHIRAVKNVTMNEHFFQGHFPGNPIMPGVLILESMAQAGAVLGFVSSDDSTPDNSLFYFAGINNARFKKPVVPGDTLVMDVTRIKQKRSIVIFEATAKVDGQVVCSAEIMCSHKEV